MITLSPDSNKSKLLSSQNGGRIRDVSFSSYLDGSEETFILKLTESEEENFKSHNPKCHENDLYLVRNKVEDNEIDVFNADKYFNGQGGVLEEDEISPGFDNNKGGIHQNTNPELELYQMKQLIQSAGTPCISSKSSLNSRSSLLLHSIPQNQQSHKTNNRSNKKSFFSKLGCNCNDKNSVNVIDDNHQLGITSFSNCSSGRRSGSGKAGDFFNMIGHQTKSCARKEIHSRKVGNPGIEIRRGGEDFMFPMLKSNRQEEVEDAARKSLEVFGTDVQRSRNISGLSVERRLNMLTWDGIDIEIPSKSSRLYNDSDSEASSDLFEIESFSTNPSQYFTTQASGSDATSRTTCYAPSEASIDWSVVTASAADFAVMSDSEELRTNSSRIRTYGKNSPGGWKSKRHSSSILSGCYSHKAVKVVGDAYRTGEQVSTPRH